MLDGRRLSAGCFVAMIGVTACGSEDPGSAETGPEGGAGGRGSLPTPGAGGGAPSPGPDAAGGAGSVTPAADPAAPGPHGVGTTTLTFERTDSVTGAPRPLEVFVWYPARADGSVGATPPVVADARAALEGPFPLVLFSHGSGGLPQQSAFFAVHAASHGFVVAAPPHPGNTAVDCFPCFDDPSKTAGTLANRPDDVLFVLDSMLDPPQIAGSPLEGIVDPDRIAMSGHSAGGWTTLEVMSRDPRFKGGIPMAPATVMRAPDMSAIRVPLMTMVGGLDGLTPGGIQATRALPDGVPYWILEMPRAGHMSFTEFCIPTPIFAGCTPEDLPAAAGHAIINTHGVAFLNAVVAERPGYEPYLSASTDLAGGEATLETR